MSLVEEIKAKLVNLFIDLSQRSISKSPSLSPVQTLPRLKCKSIGSPSWRKLKQKEDEDFVSSTVEGLTFS